MVKPHPLRCESNGSSPLDDTNAFIAQLIELSVLTRQVAGLSPAGGTKKFFEMLKKYFLSIFIIKQLK